MTAFPVRYRHAAGPGEADAAFPVHREAGYAVGALQLQSLYRLAQIHQLFLLPGNGVQLVEVVEGVPSGEILVGGFPLRVKVLRKVEIHLGVHLVHPQRSVRGQNGSYPVCIGTLRYLGSFILRHPFRRTLRQGDTAQNGGCGPLRFLVCQVIHKFSVGTAAGEVPGLDRKRHVLGQIGGRVSPADLVRRPPAPRTAAGQHQRQCQQQGADGFCLLHRCVSPCIIE